MAFQSKETVWFSYIELHRLLIENLRNWLVLKDMTHSRKHTKKW